MSDRGHDLDAFQRRWGAGALCLIGFGLLVLCGRLVWIKEKTGPALVEAAARQQYGESTVPARRGMVLDRSGRVVAAGRQMTDVFLDPRLVENLEYLAQHLGPRLNLAPEEILQKVAARPDSRFILLAERMEDDDVEAVKKVATEMKLKGVGYRERAARAYPLGRSMAHVLGFVDYDGHGVEGLEKKFDAHLHGTDGVRATIRDEKRRAIWRCADEGRPPVDGGHVVLTIDAEIQRIVEVAIAERATELKAESAVGVVMAPKTGEVLAMACWPAFDPARPGGSRKEQEAQRNRCITDPVEPGSVVKPFIATGALAGRFVSRTDQFFCHNGTYTTKYRTIKDVSPQGTLTIDGIVTKSSNIGMALIGERMGAKALYATVRRFGFGETTGIELPGEDGGLVRHSAKWKVMSITSVPMGYEWTATPLQLLTGFCAILNDGMLLKPRVVKALLGPDGETLESFDQPVVVRRVGPEEVTEYLAHEVMVHVVNEGSGQAAKLDAYQVLGKTGTAKLIGKKKTYEQGQYLASCLAAAPAHDPEVAVLVMIRRPDARIEYYGGKVSAPTVGRILSETLRYLDVPPDGKPMRVAER